MGVIKIGFWWRRVLKNEIDYALDKITQIESLIRKGVSEQTEEQLMLELRSYYSNLSRFSHWLDEEITKVKPEGEKHE